MTNEEAIAYFKRHIDLYCVEGISREAEEMAIKAIGQEPRWIPVSERLPEEHKEVLTCGLGGYIEIQSFEDSYDGYWENKNGDWSDLDEIIAWMPLPQPYKEESEG